jgi:hypothetical protein
MHPDSVFHSNPMLSIAQDQLATDERLLWCGQPSPTRAMLPRFLVWFFAIPWTAFAIFFMVMTARTALSAASGAASEAGERVTGSGSSLDFLLLFVALPFVFIGFAMLSVPYWLYRKAQKTMYAISDKRVLIIQMGKSHDIQSHGVQLHNVQSYSGEGISNTRRFERPDKSGDLVFFLPTTNKSRGDTYTTTVKVLGVIDQERSLANHARLHNIPNVRHVEELMRATFKIS